MSWFKNLFVSGLYKQAVNKLILVARDNGATRYRMALIRWANDTGTFINLRMVDKYYEELKQAVDSSSNSQKTTG